MDKPETEQLECKNCGALFTPRKGWQTFCKDFCRQEYHMKVREAGTKAMAEGAARAKAQR